MDLRFPADVRGWLLEDEGRALHEWARGRRVLEVGSFCGRSTICLAQSAVEVVSVDPHDGRGTGAPCFTLGEFRQNLARYGVTYTVTEIVGPLESATLEGTFDAAFIDAAHDYASVVRDIENACGALRPGGDLAFHDYWPGDPGVVRAVNELAASGWRITSTVARVAFLSPAASCATA